MNQMSNQGMNMSNMNMNNNMNQMGNQNNNMNQMGNQGFNNMRFNNNNNNNMLYNQSFDPRMNQQVNRTSPQQSNRNMGNQNYMSNNNNNNNNNMGNMGNQNYIPNNNMGNNMSNMNNMGNNMNNMNNMQNNNNNMNNMGNMPNNYNVPNNNNNINNNNNMNNMGMNNMAMNNNNNMNSMGMNNMPNNMGMSNIPNNNNNMNNNMNLGNMPNNNNNMNMGNNLNNNMNMGNNMNQNNFNNFMKDIPRGSGSSWDYDKENRKSSDSHSGSDKKYIVRIPSHQFTQENYDYTSLKNIFPRLQISPDFTRLVASWVETTDGADQSVNINQTIPFYIDYKDFCIEKIDINNTSFSGANKLNKPVISGNCIKYNAKVMLYSYYSNSEDPSISKRLKFLVAKEDKDISCIGGSWNPELDGEDINDPQTLINTAIRTTKEYTQIDLSSVKKWVKFMEVHYYRPPTDEFSFYQEITVVYIPNISEIPPLDVETLMKNNSKGLETDKQGEEQSTITPNTILPHNSKKFYTVTTPSSDGNKFKAMMLSLDGLLDYDETDVHESTFEASLFSELFYLMLARDMGTTILNTIINYRTPSSEEDTSSNTTHKRKRDETDRSSESRDPAGKTEHQGENHEEKKIKIDGSNGNIPNGLEHGEVSGGDQGENKDASSPSKDESNRSSADCQRDDAKSLEAFQFFDINKTLYLKEEDVENIIHNLGLYLSKYYVQNVVQKVSTEYNPKQGRVYYEKILKKYLLIQHQQHQHQQHHQQQNQHSQHYHHQQHHQQNQQDNQEQHNQNNADQYDQEQNNQMVQDQQDQYNQQEHNQQNEHNPDKQVFENTEQDNTEQNDQVASEDEQPIVVDLESQNFEQPQENIANE
ncbi:hypothetical protein DICPUDRAFT_147099 [Dictyostelium purpureum]|uniref:EF-hand domain-containing protein n=1 Tax=Dictyostelium purpureum TaxID=5786 RepID=F0Z7N3_DICPU|nr:uncharacterized protein DICPUDRAFT_147099 [Dictyostelium purpureum]EGC40045.1 hypothetical protein DICPUDRAFT_147099 [Dictyostelium purpureum]|eukprot:XP_003283394.1 hypothetical protein DICPUDRAFT_147099 [Dictyostelium purpureum]